MRQILVVLFFILFNVSLAQAQKKEYTKSNYELVKQLRAEKRIARNELFQLFDYYNDNDNDSVYKLAHKVIEIGIKQEDWFYINYGKALVVVFYNNGDYLEMATRLAQESLNYFLNQNDYEMISYLQNQIGISFVLAKKNKEAIKWFEKSIESGRETNDFASNCVGLKNIAETYYNENNTEKAIKYATKFLDVISSTNNNVAKVKAFNTIGNIYRDMDKMDKARYYYEKALAFPLTSKTAITEGNVLNNLAMVYFEEDPNKSKEFFLKSLAIRKTVNRPVHIADSYLNLGHWHFMTENLDSAAYYYNTMLTYSHKAKHVEGELEALESLQGLEEERGNDEMRDYYKQLYEKLAEESKQKKLQIIDEFTNQTERLIQEENDLIKDINQKQKERFLAQDLHKQQVVIIGILILTSLVGGIVFLNKKRKILFKTEK